MTLQVQGEGEAQVLRFATTVEDESRRTPGIRCASDRPPHQEPTPYLRVRDNLEALVHRNVFYQLVELAVPPPDRRHRMARRLEPRRSFPSARSRTDRRSMKKGPEGLFVCLTCWGSSARRYLPAPPR